jgi:hypothetical protein
MRKWTGNRMRQMREAWKRWLALNTNELTWIALIAAGVLVSGAFAGPWPS